jgi:hypothetical protein
MSVLSAIAGHQLTFEWAGVETNTNLYTMLVGRSGHARKTTAIRHGRKIIQAVHAEVLGAQPGSDEGLVDSLAGQPDQLIIYAEFSEFLAKSAKGYLNPVRTRFVDVFDGNKIARQKAGGKAKSVVCDHPRLSLLVGATPIHLEEHTTASDWSGGFMSRFCIVEGTRKKSLKIPPLMDPVKFNKAVKSLRERKAKPVGKFGGFEKAAMDRYVAFTDQFESFGLTNKQTEVERGLTDRLGFHVLKYATLFAYDLGLTTKNGYTIPDEAMKPAVQLGSILFNSAQELAPRITQTEDQRNRRRVLDVVDTSEGYISIGDIITGTKIQKNKLNPVLESLACEGRIEVVMEGPVPHYKSLGAKPSTLEIQ